MDDDDTLALGGAGADAPDSFITTLLPLLALLILVLALLLPLTLLLRLCVTLPMLLLLLLFDLRPLLDARLSRDSGTGGLCATTGTVIGDDDVEEEFE